MLVDHQNKKILLKTKRYDELKEILPAEQVYPGIVAVPHTDDAIRILRNLGANTRGVEPILTEWKWPVLGGVNELRMYQKETAAFLSCLPRGYCLHPPRMGKTASALAAILYMMDTKKVNGALIICPIAAFGDWERELFSMRPTETPVILHGKNRGYLRSGKGAARIFIINPRGPAYIAKDISAAVMAGRIGVAVVDELTEYQTKTTAQWKSAQVALRHIPYLWGMTGTPGKALQTFGQMALINPHPNLPTSYVKFREMVATNPFGFKWVERPNAKDTVYALMQPAIRFDKRDVLKLAEPQIEFIDADLTAEQSAAYELVKRNQRMVTGNETITAVNAGVLVSKLLQISAGAVKTDTGETVSLDITPRMDAIEHIIRHKSESKVVIFAAFRGAMARIGEELTKRGITHATIHGDVNPLERKNIVHAFTQEESPHVLIAHPRTAQYSLELAVADTIIFWGPILSGAYSYEQCKNRILSPKQKSLTPAIVHLQSSEAERKLHRAVIAGVDAQTEIVNLFRHEILGV